MARPAPRIARDLVKWKRKPNDRLRPKHRAWINTLPCLACGKPGPGECTHVRSSMDGGTGIKPADRFTVPLCPSCHRHQHQIGETAFFAELGIDPVDTALRLWAVTGDSDAGERAIFRSRQAIRLKRWSA